MICLFGECYYEKGNCTVCGEPLPKYLLKLRKHEFRTNWFLLALFIGLLWIPWGNWTIFKSKCP